MSNIPNAIPAAAAAAAGGAIAAIAPARSAGPPSRETEGGSFSQWLAHSRANGAAPADRAAPKSTDATEPPARGRTPSRKDACDKDTAHRVRHQAHRSTGAAAARADAARSGDAVEDGGTSDAADAGEPADAARDVGEYCLDAAADAKLRGAGEPVTGAGALIAATPAEDAPEGGDLASAIVVAGAASNVALAGGAAVSRTPDALGVGHGDDSVALSAVAAGGGGTLAPAGRAGTARAAALTPDVRRATQLHDDLAAVEPRDPGQLDRRVAEHAGVDDDTTAGLRAPNGRLRAEAARADAAGRDAAAGAAAPLEAFAARTATPGGPPIATGVAAPAVEAFAATRLPPGQVELTAPGFDVAAIAPAPGSVLHATNQPIDAPATTAALSSLAVPFDDAGFALALGSRLAVLAREGVHRAELQLNPADMGPISVQIALDGTRVTVDLGAAVAATRERLEASLHELAAALRESGLTLAGGGVHEHRRDRNNATQREAGAEGRGNGASRQAAADEAVAPAVATRRTLRGVVDLYA